MKPAPKWFKILVGAVLAGFVLFVAGITYVAVRLPDFKQARPR